MALVEEIMDDFMVHCVGGCHKGQWRNLRGLKPSEIRCSSCDSEKIAIWRNRACLFSYSGKVDYPMGDTEFGSRVKGG